MKPVAAMSRSQPPSTDTSSTSTMDRQASTVNLNSSLFQHALDELVGLRWVELTGDVLHLARRSR